MGDVKCLHCGFVSGSWVGERGAPLLSGGFTPREGPAAALPDRVLRCLRCDGSVYLEDMAAVQSASRMRRIKRLRRQLAAFDARPGAA